MTEGSRGGAHARPARPDRARSGMIGHESRACRSLSPARTTAHRVSRASWPSYASRRLTHGFGTVSLRRGDSCLFGSFAFILHVFGACAAPPGLCKRGSPRGPASCFWTACRAMARLVWRFGKSGVQAGGQADARAAGRAQPGGRAGRAGAHARPSGGGAMCVIAHAERA